MNAAEIGERWYLLPEPGFQKHELTLSLKGARATNLVPVIGKGAELTFPDAHATRISFPSDAELRNEAAANANAILSSLTPEWIRNRKDVVLYGIIQSDYPLVATVLTAPDLRNRFADVLGSKLLAVVPNRYTVYVFPALASTYQDHEGMIRAAYRATPYPVSLEVFEVSEEGLKAIGTFE